MRFESQFSRMNCQMFSCGFAQLSGFVVALGWENMQHRLVAPGKAGSRSVAARSKVRSCLGLSTPPPKASHHARRASIRSLDKSRHCRRGYLWLCGIVDMPTCRQVRKAA
jgi:hypothetical protein